MNDWIETWQNSRKKVEDLYQKAASALMAPRRVTVRWQEPYNGSSNGSVSKTLLGMYVIDISPQLGAQAEFDTFLHEIGHALDGGQIPSEAHKLAPGAVTRTWEESEARREDPAIKVREARADAIAAKLAALADAGAVDHLKYGEPVIFAKLRALANISREEYAPTEAQAWMEHQAAISDRYRAKLAKLAKRGVE